MKSITIHPRREFFIWLVIFILSNLLNVYSIIHYKTQWKELFTQTGICFCAERDDIFSDRFGQTDDYPFKKKKMRLEKYSFGMGDRFGKEGIAQLQAIREDQRPGSRSDAGME